jgi:hypothetical protein
MYLITSWYIPVHVIHECCWHVWKHSATAMSHASVKCGNFLIFNLTSAASVLEWIQAPKVRLLKPLLVTKRVHGIEPIPASLSASHMREQVGELSKGWEEARG